MVVSTATTSSYRTLRADHQDAYAAGQGVTEYASTGKAAQELRELWQWTNKKAKGKTR